MKKATIIIGPQGSGKSTTAHALAAFAAANEKVCVFDPPKKWDLSENKFEGAQDFDHCIYCLQPFSHELPKNIATRMGCPVTIIRVEQSRP